MIKDLYTFSLSIFIKDRFPIIPVVLIIIIGLLHTYGLKELFYSIDSIELIESVAVQEGLDSNTIEDEQVFGRLLWKGLFQQKEFWLKYGIWMTLLLLGTLTSITGWLTRISTKEIKLPNHWVFFSITLLGSIGVFILNYYPLSLLHELFPIPIYLLLILAIELSKERVKPFKLSILYPRWKMFIGLGRVVLHSLFSIVLVTYYALGPFICYSIFKILIPHFVAQSGMVSLILIGQAVLFLVCVLSVIKCIGVSYYAFLQIVYKTGQTNSEA